MVAPSNELILTKATFSHCYRGTILLLVWILCSACAVMPKPDTCECSSCELDPSWKASPVELALLEDNASISEREIEICACRPWNPSGIMVEKGQEYIFKIIQDQKMEDWIDGSTKATPSSGWTGKLENTIGYLVGFLKRSDKGNWYALIGAIGQCDEDSFAISPKPVVMTKRGELNFYANDMEGRYFNNKGRLKLKVVRIR